MKEKEEPAADAKDIDPLKALMQSVNQKKQAEDTKNEERRKLKKQLYGQRTIRVV